MMSKIYYILIIITLMSCGSTTVKKKLFINSHTTNCVGVGPMQCLQVKYTESDDWSSFYDAIEGFEYQPRFLYELEIQVDSLDKKTIPADKSIYTYKLTRIISKKIDRKNRLNDIWVATHINKSALDRSKELPQIEMSLKAMQLIGTDGCNSIRSAITNITDTNLSFGNIMGTKKMCPNMEISNRFNDVLSNVTFYRFENLELYLFDEQHKEIIRLLKVD